MFDCVFITLVLPLIFAVCLLLLLAAIEVYCCFYGQYQSIYQLILANGHTFDYNRHAGSYRK